MLKEERERDDGINMYIYVINLKSCYRGEF